MPPTAFFFAAQELNTPPASVSGMVAKRILVLFMLLALPAASAFAADGLQKAGVIEIFLNQEASAVGVEETSSGGIIDYFSANVSLYPRESEGQVLVSRDVSTLPKAGVEYVNGNMIISWKDPTEPMLKFFIESRVRVLNYLYKVKSPIPFPYGEYSSGPFGKDVNLYKRQSKSIVLSDAIRKKSSEIIEGETDYYRAVFKVGEWVNKNINYSLDTLTADAVQDSDWVLQNRYGVCDEITVLFIALLRASDIPARFVAGQVYSEKEKGFGSHGWAEVYFPGVGWVPFDVTFSQLGWIDPTHIKLDTELDPAESSVSYEWKARGMDMNMNPFRIDAKIALVSGEIQKHAEMGMEPLRNDVSNGSFVPVKLTIRNLEAYYLPVTITFTKAPELLEPNTRTVLLQPYEEKALFWTVAIPANMTGGYYITYIEAGSPFAGIAGANITFGEGYSHYSREWAEETAGRLAPREEKAFIPGIELSCRALKDYYYRRETAEISCTLQNKGNTNFRPLKTCLETECRDVDLLIGETKQVDWSVPLKGINVTDFAVTAESRDMIKIVYPRLHVVEVPEIIVSGFGPEKIAYGATANMSFLVDTEYEARNITVAIQGVGSSTISRLGGKKEIVLPFDSRAFRGGSAKIELKYYDNAGGEYTDFYDFPIDVYDIPWTVKLIMWL